MTMNDVQENRFLDLDAAFDEKSDLVVRLKGKDYSLPGQPSAKVMMKFLRYVEGGSLQNQHVEDFFSELVGEDSYNGMMDNGMSYEQMEHLVQWLLQEYGITKAGEGDGGSPNVME